MIIAFTGAGISKASGIATFMEQPDVRDRLYRSYAQKNPKSYRYTVKKLYNTVIDAEPNDAHYALNEYDVSIITMNIDGLHEKAGSLPLTLHGTLPSFEELKIADTLYNKPVLYGDQAPNYQKAYQMVSEMSEEDTLLVIGASHHTAIAQELRNIALYNGVRIIEIQEDAVRETREVLERLQQPANE